MRGSPGLRPRSPRCRTRSRSQAGLAAENASLRQQVARLQAREDASPNARHDPAPGAPFTAVPSPASANNQPVVASTFSGGEPGIATADGRFSLNLYALVQLDAALYDQAAPGPVSTDLRRTRPGARLLGVERRQRPRPQAEGRRRLPPRPDRLQRQRLRRLPVPRPRRFRRLGRGELRPALRSLGAVQRSSSRFTCASAPSRRRRASPTRIRRRPALPRTADLRRHRPQLRRRRHPHRRPRPSPTATATWRRSPSPAARSASPTAPEPGTPQTYGDQLGLRRAACAGTPLQGNDWLVHVGGHAQYISHPADTSRPAGQRDLAAVALHAVAQRPAGAAGRRDQADQHRQHRRPPRQRGRRRGGRAIALVPDPERIRPLRHHARRAGRRAIRASTAGTSRAAG